MSDTFPVTIFHNPACGTSRNVVAMVQAAGYAPQVVEYLQVGWTAQQLRDLAAAAGVPLRAFLREKGTPAEALGLLGAEVTEAQLAAAMVDHPILVNRPIVITPRGTMLARPSEAVLDLLERRPRGFIKEDGQIVGGDG